MKHYFLILLFISLGCSHNKHIHSESCDHEVTPVHKFTKNSKKLSSKKTFSKKQRSLASRWQLEEVLGGPGCEDMTRNEFVEIYYTIDRLGGRLHDPLHYEMSEEGLDRFLVAVGVDIRHFSAKKMITPHNKYSAKKCGNSTLLPPRCRWIGAAVQGMYAMKFLELTDNNIYIRNWWRPECYNSRVGGAKRSDHLQARGFDLDFKTAKERARAQKWLCEMYKEKPFNLQVGIGCRTLHVGTGSPRGARYWTYSSLDKCSIKREKGDNCWFQNNQILNEMDDAEFGFDN